MNSSLFITGTDTDVGKTLLTAALLVAARRRGRQAMVMKPLQSGATRTGDGWAAPDPDLCLRLADVDVDAETYRDVAPCCFEPPCSPHLAAAEARMLITLPPLLDAYRRLSLRFDPLIVEGAGGAFVPINPSQTMLSLMQAFDLPVVVAARPGLGTINHTLLTLHALRSHGLRICGVVFVETHPVAWGTIERDNRSTIEERGQVRVLGVIPYLEGILRADAAPQALVEAGEGILRAVEEA